MVNLACRLALKAGWGELWVGPADDVILRKRGVEFVDEIPHTATGKIQRFKLREGA